MNDLLKPFMAGFDLAAKRGDDGLLHSYGDPDAPAMQEWPETVTMFGVTYGLEDVVIGNNGYESGIYA
jgi:hypothetical protein